MPELGSIYDAWHFQPVVKVGENLCIYTGGKWQPHICQYQVPIAPGRPTIVDLVATSAVPAPANIPANGTLNKQIVTIMQLDSNEFTQMRFEPLDYVEGAVWELAGQQLHKSKNIHSRVTPTTRVWDPFLASSTFFVLGSNKDMNLEVYNPMGYAQWQARFIFWGCRMLVELHPDYVKAPDRIKALIEAGDKKTIADVIGPITRVPAEGRG